ncbi:MAG: hypothetical protein IJE66_01820 [Akkermansia sp.]|nr:hypothetical protein [Akkermansia sp.]
MLLLLGAAVFCIGSAAEAALSIHVGRRGPLPPPPPHHGCRPCVPRCRVPLPPPPPRHCGKHRKHRHHHGRAPRRCYNYTVRF